MAVTLEEIIIGTSLNDIECFEIAKECYVSHVMFEDPILADIYNDMEKTYKDGTFNGNYSSFDISIYKDKPTKLFKAIDVMTRAHFPILKWEFNRTWFFTRQGNWTDIDFSDYVKTFVNNYEERCKSKKNKMS